MSFTAVGFLVVYALSIVFAVIYHPIFGLYAYLWAFYNHPLGRWWGPELPDWRWSLIAGIITLLPLMWWKPSTPKYPWHANWGARLLILFTLWMWLQTFWAVNTEYHLDGSILFTKYVLLFYLIIKIISDEKSLKLFSWGHILGCFIFGWLAYHEPVVGRLETVGGPGVGDANSLGSHLITGVAFAGFMFIGSPGKMRWLAFATIPFMLNAIILTLSRGASIGLLAAAMAAWYLVPRTHRHWRYIGAPLAVVLFLMLAHSYFWDRMATIPLDTEENIESSALTRVALFEANWKMFEDNPWGAGHRGNEVISREYLADEYLSETGFRSAHNTFMAVLVDHGLPGAIIFTLIMLWAAYSIWRLKCLDKAGLAPSLGMYRAAIGTSLMGLFVSGQFSNLFKAEVHIWLIALLVALQNISRDSLLRSTKQMPPLTIG